jgi:hypothetical protein
MPNETPIPSDLEILYRRVLAERGEPDGLLDHHLAQALTETVLGPEPDAGRRGHLRLVQADPDLHTAWRTAYHDRRNEVQDVAKTEWGKRLWATRPKRGSAQPLLIRVWFLPRVAPPPYPY